MQTQLLRPSVGGAVRPSVGGVGSAF